MRPVEFVADPIRIVQASNLSDRNEKDRKPLFEYSRSFGLNVRDFAGRMN